MRKTTLFAVAMSLVALFAAMTPYAPAQSQQPNYYYGPYGYYSLPPSYSQPSYVQPSYISPNYVQPRYFVPYTYQPQFYQVQRYQPQFYQPYYYSNGYFNTQVWVPWVPAR